MKYFLIGLLFLVDSLYGQSIIIKLDSLSTLDDTSLHLTTLSDTAEVKLVLPKLQKDSKCKFFTLFYSWKISKNPDVPVLDIQQQDKDVIYVDKNNDKDLADDGMPYIFPHSKNKLYIDINSTKDSNQVVRLVIYRIPEIPDTLIPKYVDRNGNLNPAFAKYYGGIKGDFNYKGEKGSFYFDDRVTLRRGKVELNGTNYAVGLFDYSNNGLYNDDDDLLLIDLNRDGKLKYFDQNEVFKLNDVFRIGKSNYKLAHVDKYGKEITLMKTSNNPTEYFLKSFQSQTDNQKNKNILNDDFWNLSFTSLDGKTIKVNNFKGKYIFINVWGEWCIPCIEEIPELLKGYAAWKDKVVFLSIIKTQNIDKAKELIAKDNIPWSQVLMNADFENRLKIVGYPTNILIFPDGKTYLREGPINHTFFELNVK